MTIADLEPGKLDLRMTRGNDLTLRLTFNIDLTGFHAWEANAEAHDVLYPFTIDNSDQGNRVIVAHLEDAATAEFAIAKWDLKVLDPSDDVFTILAGTIRTREGVS